MKRVYKYEGMIGDPGKPLRHFISRDGKPYIFSEEFAADYAGIGEHFREIANMLNAEIDRMSVPPIDSREMSHTGKLARARAELEQERNLTSNLSAHRDQLEGRAEKAEKELARARKEIERLSARVPSPRR